jgi:hypothetical protein
MIEKVVRKAICFLTTFFIKGRREKGSKLGFAI